MRGNDAYAVLGLRPGAERAEIEQAYRRLIKRYHPDYAGGDAGRAAEINRAYSELRARPGAAFRPQPPRAAAVPRHIYARPPSKWRLPVFAVIAIGTAALVASATMTERNPPWHEISIADRLAADDGRDVRPSSERSSFEEPLSIELIESSVGDAKRLYDLADPVVAAEFSRECLNRLSAKPSVPLFDSCAAYDEAIALLTVGNPVFDSGPFNPLAVTARQVGSARLLSADDFEAESRLQQIRSRVHMALLPQIADGGRAAARRVSAIVPASRIARTPRYVARPVRLRSAPPAALPHTRREPPPQLSVEYAPQPPVARVSLPPKPVAARPATAAQSRPAWQKPMQPVWQRPLPAER